LIELGVKKTFCDDYMLHGAGQIIKDDNTPYTIYTPYSKKAAQILPFHVTSLDKEKFRHKALALQGLNSESALSKLQKIVSNFHFNIKYCGGRELGLKLLNNIIDFSDYSKFRDFPAADKTTKLSPHLKFGTLSPREVYWRVCKIFNKDHLIIRELYWRDFFTQIAFYFPHIFGNSFRRQYDKIAWQNNPEWFELWKAGQTGFPIVDAGMRELKNSGFMHNRVRMISASFLIKDMHINWQEGEKYFAQMLVDYDPSVNNGNWQWVASSGCDAQPFFRIFNPWLQQKKFDPDCSYIKKWVPELTSLSNTEIHNLGEYATFSNTNKVTHKSVAGYAKPILDHFIEKKVTEEMYSVITNKEL
jgi:deoxyribodipyrimidine photo-lyase